MKKIAKFSSLTIVSALAASSCCIAPILALLLGSSSLATSFSWLEPAQPFFIGFTVLLLAYAWFKKIKSRQQACCANPTTTSFFQRTTTLVILTIVSGLLLAFPFYSSVFYPTPTRQIHPITATATQVELQIQGMTCEACSQHITHEVSQLKGILGATISYADQKGVIAFDREQISIQEIEQTIQAIGYQTQVKNN